MLFCREQQDCLHFTTGDNHPPNHHVRVTMLCIHWKDDCVVLGELLTVAEYCTGYVYACNIADVRAKKEKIRGK